MSSVDDYLADLARLLPRGRRRRARILAEVEAHLRDAAAEGDEGEALERVGSARLVAAGFARRQAASGGRLLVAVLVVLLAARLAVVWYVRREAQPVHIFVTHWPSPLSPHTVTALTHICNLTAVVGLTALGVAAAVVLGRPGTVGGTHARIAAALLLALGVLVGRSTRLGVPVGVAALACCLAAFALARRGRAGIDVVTLAAVAATLGLAALGAIPVFTASTLLELGVRPYGGLVPLSLLLLWGAAAFVAAAAAVRLARDNLATRALRREPAHPEPG